MIILPEYFKTTIAQGKMCLSVLGDWLEDHQHPWEPVVRQCDTMNNKYAAWVSKDFWLQTLGKIYNTIPHYIQGLTVEECMGVDVYFPMLNMANHWHWAGEPTASTLLFEHIVVSPRKFLEYKPEYVELAERRERYVSQLLKDIRINIY